MAYAVHLVSVCRLRLRMQQTMSSAVKTREDPSGASASPCLRRDSVSAWREIGCRLQDVLTLACWTAQDTDRHEDRKVTSFVIQKCRDAFFVGEISLTFPYISIHFSFIQRRVEKITHLITTSRCIENATCMSLTRGSLSCYKKRSRIASI